MDLNTYVENEKLLSWEQYVYPPLGESLLMGDVLRIGGSDPKDPMSYRLLLTPSCDTQMNKAGKCKVESVLVAKCTHFNDYFKSCKVKTGRMTEDLPSRLRESQQGGFVPLPAYGEKIPNMAANLKDLELIPINDINMFDRTGEKFERVASIDSPFRENIAWAYMQIAGRPGMPERDMAKWAQEVKPEIEKAQAEAIKAQTEAIA